MSVFETPKIVVDTTNNILAIRSYSNPPETGTIYSSGQLDVLAGMHNECATPCDFGSLVVDINNNGFSNISIKYRSGIVVTTIWYSNDLSIIVDNGSPITGTIYQLAVALRTALGLQPANF
jgi:hypothetical protein